MKMPFFSQKPINSNQPKKVFVTGGAGFIGSWVTKVLLNEGYEVTVYDDLSKGHKEGIDGRATFVEGSIADTKLLTKSLAGHDTVIHMAAFIEVAESIKKPVEYAENNVVNAIRLLEAMRTAGVRRIVFSSSATVYGIPQHLPITEADPLGIASNPYGASKVSTEFYCQVYNQLYGFTAIVLRYFNPYGPGELHEPESHAIPNFIKSALANRAIPLYWKGETVRDFIYVEDLARAHTAVLGLEGLHTFNIGTERGIKINDVIATLSKILGKELQINDLGDRPGDVMATYASSAKIAQATGWQANVNLEEGLKRTINYFKARLNV